MEWRKALNELERAARELYRLGHAYDGDLACELTYLAAPVMDAVQEALPKLEKLAARELKAVPATAGEWGHLPGEPCRYCHVQGKVYFQIDDGPEGKQGLQAIRCDACGRTWTADSANA